MDDAKQFIGVTFDGRYKVTREVGIGGMAFVYEATDEKTGRRVALKLLKEKFSDDTRAVKRFINESKSLELLNHPNIVKIHDISVHTKYKYIVMEYIDGITLRKYMNYKKALDWREAVEFADQIALALDNAHTKGIVHRDIKPQNIMIMQEGKLKVMDFGIAKMPNSESLTMVDKAIGTVYYISPEQASSRKIDARSDIYSLGVMLYEMVTGHMPFTAETPIAVIMQHMNTPPTPPSKLVPNIPKGLEQIILCAMEKNPSNRYQSAAQMLRHLRRLKIDERTVFNIARPAPRTPTSEITLKKTMRHTHDTPESATTAPTTANPAPFPTEKHTIGTKPAQKPKPSAPSATKTAVQGTAKAPSQPVKKPVAGTPTQAVKKTPSGAPKKQAPPRKKSKTKISYTTIMLVICILILLFAIFGISSLFLSPDNVSEPMAFNEARISLEQNLLYLKQGIL